MFKKIKIFEKIKIFIFQKSLLMAIGLLISMGMAMTASVWDDTVTTDENLAIGIGDLILKNQYFKIGFEHPPLMRDLVAIPLMFMERTAAIEFIDPGLRGDLSSYAFNFGQNYIYQNRAAPENILLAARMPVIFLTLIFGFLIFIFCKQYFNLSVAYLSLILYVLSPFFLAHGRLATLDVPTAAFSFITIWALLNLLGSLNFKNSLLMGAALGSALLVKFPMASLVPFLTIIYFVHCFNAKGSLKQYLKHFGIVFIVAFTFVYALYFYHLWAYPLAEHVFDIKENLIATRSDIYSRVNWILNLAGSEWTRPIAHYLYGMYWQMLRSGAFGYFMGDGSLTSWTWYYPFGFVAKNPISFVLLCIFALGATFVKLFKSEQKLSIRMYIQTHFIQLILCFWIIYYAGILIFLNSGNTGSRYIMPILVPIIILVSKVVVQHSKILPKLILYALILIQAISIFRSYPNFLSYFSELVGGAERGSYYLVDTDVEWGQDIQRLATWVDSQKITEISVAVGFNYQRGDGAVVQNIFSDRVYRHYLKDKFKPHYPGDPVQGWLAVPARLLRWGQARPAKHSPWSSSTYKFLENKSPAHVVGGSIYIFQL